MSRATSSSDGRGSNPAAAPEIRDLSRCVTYLARRYRQSLDRVATLAPKTRALSTDIEGFQRAAARRGSRGSVARDALEEARAALREVEGELDAEQHRARALELTISACLAQLVTVLRSPPGLPVRAGGSADVAVRGVWAAPSAD